MLSRVTSSRSISARSRAVPPSWWAWSLVEGPLQLPAAPWEAAGPCSSGPGRRCAWSSRPPPGAASEEQGAEDGEGIGEPAARTGVQAGEEQHAQGQDSAAEGQLPVQSHVRVRRRGGLSGHVPAEPVAHAAHRLHQDLGLAELLAKPADVGVDGAAYPGY